MQGDQAIGGRFEAGPVAGQASSQGRRHPVGQFVGALHLRANARGGVAEDGAASDGLQLAPRRAYVFDGPADPYVNLIMCDGGGYNVLTLSNYYAWQNNWMAWDVDPGTLLDMEAELDGRNFFYGLPHPDCDVVGIEVRDYDDLSGDDWLMDDEETHWYDFSGQQLVDWGKSDSVIEITQAP